MSALEFHGVTVTYGSGARSMTAVDAVTLSVPAGTVVGLVGESGSGKSTLARSAVGLTPLASGNILVDGVNVSSIPLRRRTALRPQMVFQDPNSSLNPRMTIGESVREALAPVPGARSGRVAIERVNELLELVDVGAERSGVLPGALSGGQRQRVALARALASEPRFLIADEITAALDVSVQGTILNLVLDLQRRLGFGMLFISHNLAVVRYVSDTVAVMYRGQLVEVAPVEQLLTTPEHPYTRSLISSIPTLAPFRTERGARDPHSV